MLKKFSQTLKKQLFRRRRRKKKFTTNYKIKKKTNYSLKNIFKSIFRSFHLILFSKKKFCKT